MQRCVFKQIENQKLSFLTRLNLKLIRVMDGKNSPILNKWHFLVHSNYYKWLWRENRDKDIITINYVKTKKYIQVLHTDVNLNLNSTRIILNLNINKNNYFERLLENDVPIIFIDQLNSIL